MKFHFINPKKRLNTEVNKRTALQSYLPLALPPFLYASNNQNLRCPKKIKSYKVKRPRNRNLAKTSNISCHYESLAADQSGRKKFILMVCKSDGSL